MVAIMPEQPGMEIGYLKEKRQKLLDELHSDEHYDATETIAYGEHDPFDVPVCTCDKCGCEPAMTRVQDRPIRWQMVCPCGNQVKQARRRPWEAALDWNMTNLDGYSYADMPLFGLSSLSAFDAHCRLVSIRANLELRRKIAGLSRVIGQRTGEIEVPGKKYHERLDAYLQWCLWGLRLTKHAAKSASHE